MVVTYTSALNPDITDEEILRSLPPEAQPIRAQILEQARRKSNYLLAFDGTSSEYYLADLAVDRNSPERIRASGKDPDVGYYFLPKERKLLKAGSRLGERYLIEEPAFSLSSTLINEQKTILGYTCLRADMEVCGKSYTVYYTPEIPAATGPEHFVGLPGLVLQVIKSGGKRTLTATQVEMQETESLGSIYTFSAEGFRSRLIDPQPLRFADLCNDVGK